MILLFAMAALAGDTWQKPPPEIESVLLAPDLPDVWADPTRETLLLATPVRYPPIAERARPMLKLAGIRIDPTTNSAFGQNGWVEPRMLRVSDGRESDLALPAGARVVGASWSADGERVALSVRTSDHVGLWVADTDGKIAEVPGVALNPLLGASVEWMPDQEHLLVKRLPPARSGPPAAPPAPDGPEARSTTGGSRSSTYEARDLLVTSHDDALFTYYATSELALVDAGDLSVQPVGKPDVYGNVDASPDGKWLLVERITPPWSHAAGWWRFAHDVEIWKPDGTLAATVAKVPADEAVPTHGAPEGPRSVGWRQDADATLVWLEALDGGDPAVKVPARDRFLTLPAPFTAEPAELWKAEHRVSSVSWGKGGLMLVEQYERERRWKHVWTLDADLGASSAKKLFDLSANDRYADPGDPLHRVTPDGRWMLEQHGDSLFFSGPGGSPDGDHPFVDKRSLKTGKTERLFQCGKGVYERPLALVDAKTATFLTWRESPTEVPNVHVVKKGVEVRAVTAFSDPTPSIRQVKKKLVTFQRADGTPLSFTLYLPPGYVEGTKLPTVLYAYPREFSDPGTAGQVTGNERTFDQFAGASHLFFALHGYAVLHNATMPVVGDPDTAYDRFVEELAANAEAAIAEAVRLGVTDPDRVGVMGHSHGALMTATLLAHTDLFRAGIARSGAYNHTIRPFGFQNERRSLWDAPNTYVKLSTVMWAPQIDEPLLLVHGAIDENPGTVPLQSERLYEAIRGTGGTARLVMLPYEGHGYQARESVEHVLYEQLTWFDAHVRDAGPRAALK